MSFFSILHPSVRPGQWKRIRDLWIERARRPDLVEYLLGYHADQREEFCRSSAGPPQLAYKFLVLVNEGPNHPTRNGRSSLVDNVNLLACHAKGSVLIVTSDDQEAPESWDEDLTAAIAEHQGNPIDEFVIQVSTDTPNDANRPELMTIQILSSARYRRFGYVFHPRYSGMYADSEFSDVAHRDGVVIDARHLIFPHRHPYFDAGVPNDRWYALANAPSEYALGRAAYVARKACGFPPHPDWNGEYL